MRLMVAGGGTGGHVYPGIALVEAMQELVEDLETQWVGTRDRMEAHAVPAAGIEIEFLDVSFLKGRRGLGLIKALLKLPMSGIRAIQLVRRFKPDAVVGLGGFVSGPVVIAAFLLRVPVFLLEQNAIPGVANRLNAKVATRIFATFEESKSHFPPARTVVAGNPIRGDILTVEHDLDQDSETLHVLVFGGSQGATSLNEVMPRTLSEAARKAGVRLSVLHGTGKGRASGVQERYDADVADAEVVEYIDDMATAYRDAEFVVCRAGATTISELTAMGMPACYVPFPHAADNHQFFNAKSVSDSGGGIVIEDGQVGDEPAVQALADVFADKSRIAEMARKARALGHPSAARSIAEEILKSSGQTRLLEGAIEEANHV